MVDIQAIISTAVAIPVLSRTASVNGTVIDMDGFNGLTFSFLTGLTATASADHRCNFKLQHGALANGDDMEDVPAANFTGSAVIDSTGDDNVVIGQMSYVPMTVAPKRYVRAVGTVTGTFESIFGALVVKTGGRKRPTA